MILWSLIEAIRLAYLFCMVFISLDLEYIDLKKVHLAILEDMRRAGRVKSQKTDKQKGLKSIWMTGFKPFFFE